jgi:hypothetical protein
MDTDFFGYGYRYGYRYRYRYRYRYGSDNFCYFSDQITDKIEYFTIRFQPYF